MSNRRTFLKTAAVGIGLSVLPRPFLRADGRLPAAGDPLVISTWNHGLAANEAAWKILSGGGYAFDAVEKGVNVSEDDPRVTSVGYGGLPDETGRVTLDACIMNEKGGCGAVAFVQNFKNPVSIARRVMEETRHIFLVGKGAEDFARAMGFPEQDLLTPESRKRWLQWKSSLQGKEPVNWKYESAPGDHDTIGMLAIDAAGRLAGACTTSGLAWKIHGRVGDSPIIGAGMYCDGEVGAAAATGVGEAVIRVCGSFLVVEAMRNGASPQKACEEAVKRVARFSPDKPQVGFIALNRAGEIGAFSVQKGFQYALCNSGKNTLIDAHFLG